MANSFFPDSAIEALSMLYIKNQDLTGKTPEEILTMYYETFFKMKKEQNKKMNDEWFIKMEEGTWQE